MKTPHFAWPVTEMQPYTPPNPLLPPPLHATVATQKKKKNPKHASAEWWFLVSVCGEYHREVHIHVQFDFMTIVRVRTVELYL